MFHDDAYGLYNVWDDGIKAMALTIWKRTQQGIWKTKARAANNTLVLFSFICILG